jgi:hypothetical protein
MQPQGGAPQQQQQVMPAPAPNAPIVQHTQYAPQHQVQGTNYQPQPQQQHQAPPAPPQPAQAPPQGQHFPHQGLNGGWQSDQDYNERRKMIAKM